MSKGCLLNFNAGDFYLPQLSNNRDISSLAATEGGRGKSR